jgi:hypothetical protein
MIRWAHLLAVGLVVAAIACGDERPLPSSPTPPVSEPSRETSALSILGAPAGLPIGQSAQLRAMAQYIDGGFVDVTQQASWQSSNEQACRVSAGMLTSAAAGVTTVTAQFGATSATARVACGYVITATVHENPPTLDVMLPDARVEVVGGPLDGQVFLTDAQGRVTLAPVDRAGFWLYFKKRGYDDLRFEIFELPRQSQLDISILREPEVRVEFSGVCTGHQGHTKLGDIPFSTHREGRVHAAMRTSGGLNAVAQMQLGMSTVASVCDPPQYSCPSGDERVLVAGNYSFGVWAPYGCPAGATWTFSVEHQR